MALHQETLEVRTRAAGLSNITAEVSAVVSRSQLITGLCTVFVQHTSASLVIQENADPAVLRDLTRFMSGLRRSRAPGSTHDDQARTTCRPTSAPRLTKNIHPFPSPAASSCSAHGKPCTSGSTARSDTRGAWSCISPASKRGGDAKLSRLVTHDVAQSRVDVDGVAFGV